MNNKLKAGIGIFLALAMVSGVSAEKYILKDNVNETSTDYFEVVSSIDTETEFNNAWSGNIGAVEINGTGVYSTVDYGVTPTFDLSQYATDETDAVRINYKPFDSGSPANRTIEMLKTSSMPVNSDYYKKVKFENQSSVEVIGNRSDINQSKFYLNANILGRGSSSEHDYITSIELLSACPSCEPDSGSDSDNNTDSGDDSTSEPSDVLNLTGSSDFEAITVNDTDINYSDSGVESTSSNGSLEFQSFEVETHDSLEVEHNGSGKVTVEVFNASNTSESLYSQEFTFSGTNTSEFNVSDAPSGITEIRFSLDSGTQVDSVSYNAVLPDGENVVGGNGNGFKWLDPSTWTTEQIAVGVAVTLLGVLALA